MCMIEPIQELRARLGSRLTGLNPQEIFNILPFQGGTSDLALCVCLFWCQFLYCFHLLPSVCLDNI